jgi:hypothetical protein
MIYGYSGGRPIANSILNRELDGMCISWEAFTTTLKMFFEPARLFNMLIVFGSQVPDHPWLKNAVAADAIAPNDDARRMLRIADSPGEMHLTYAVAPGVPNDRVAALRTAFDKTLADPGFVADYKKTGRPLEARTGEEVVKIANELLSSKPELATALKEALKQREGP